MGRGKELEIYRRYLSIVGWEFFKNMELLKILKFTYCTQGKSKLRLITFSAKDTTN